MKPNESVQSRYAPNSICFGCGPKNEAGLKVASILQDDPEHGFVLVAEFAPKKHHEAFPGMVNGGIMGALLDCHSNWCAAIALMKSTKNDAPPCTVTADFHVKLKAPTPSDRPIFLKAFVKELGSDRALIEAESYTTLEDGTKKLTARCTGTFVAVKEGHPAFHRW